MTLLALACAPGVDTGDTPSFSYQPPGLGITCSDEDPNTLLVTMTPRSEPLIGATVYMPDYGVEHAMVSDEDGTFRVQFTYPRTLAMCLDAGDDWLRVEWHDAAGSDAYVTCVARTPDARTCGP